MTADYHPLRVLLLSVSGWVNREQQGTIEYLLEENRVLKEQLEGRKLRLTNDQRRRFADRHWGPDGSGMLGTGFHSRRLREKEQVRKSIGFGEPLLLASSLERTATLGGLAGAPPLGVRKAGLKVTVANCLPACRQSRGRSLRDPSAIASRSYSRGEQDPCTNADPD